MVEVGRLQETLQPRSAGEILRRLPGLGMALRRPRIHPSISSLIPERSSLTTA